MPATSTNLVRLFGVVKAIVDLGPLAASDRDFTDIAQDVLDRILEAMEAEQAALFLFDPQCVRLTCLASEGFEGMQLHTQLQIGRKESQRWQETRTAHPLIANEAADFFGNYQANGPFIRGLKCVLPLRVGSGLVGALCMGARQKHNAYGELEIEALGLLAGHLAMMLQSQSLMLSLRNQISDNLRLLSSLDHSFDDALEAFATTIDAKDKHMRGHSMRVGRYSAAIASTLGFPESEVGNIRAAGQLHDIGKVTVDKSISAKTTALRPEEFREIADHTVVGHQIVSQVRFPWPQVPEVVRWHHERADGSGYPDNLRLGELALPVRIVAVSDTFDAMTSDRPYRRGRSATEAAEELVRLTPGKFDASVVEALLVQLRFNAQGKGQMRGIPGAEELRVSALEMERLSSSLLQKMSHNRVYSA